MSILRQCLGTAIISCSAINMGINFAWPAFTLTLFSSEATPLNRPMTEAEISLFGSLSSIGGILSTPTAGYLLDKFGRKYCSIINAVMLTLAWVIITLSKQVEVILTSIFLAGVASSIFLVGSIYISEICQDSVRGGMTASNIVCYGIGMLIAYLLGGCLEYYMVLYINLTLAAFGVAVLTFIKDSPIHLLAIGKEEEAKKALAFYRGRNPSSKEIFEEMITMKNTLNPDLDDTTPEEEKLQPDQKAAPKEKLSTWQFFKKSKSTQRAMLVCIIVLTASIFQGLVVVQIYADVIFQEVIPSLSSTLCSVLLAVTIVIAGMVAAFLTDRAGRRPLMLYSSIGSAVSCVILGTQMQFQWGPTWLTGVFMYVFAFMSVLGAGTVPFVLMAECFLPEVKSIVTMIIVELAWVCNFVILFIFNPLLKSLGWGPVFYVFAAICCFNFTFCFFFIPETKGLSVEAIQTLFAKKKTQTLY